MGTSDPAIAGYVISGKNYYTFSSVSVSVSTSIK